MNCPNCGNLCAAHDLYCFRCGSRLAPVQAPKKGSHRVPLLILALLTILGTVVFFVTRPNPASVNRAPSDTPWFEIRSGRLYFDPSLYTGGSEVTVPSQIGGETVVALDGSCFENCTDITTVILPDTLEEIGNNAFSDCTSLRGIYLPDSACLIGSEAFAGCSALEAIRIPASVQFIDSGAFGGCFKLNHVFYGGSFEEWAPLYEEFIGKQTMIHCTDGSFSHSAFPFAP